MSSANVAEAPSGVSRWTRRFTHEGRSYSLFKTMDADDRPFYLHFQCNHRRIKRCLDSSNLETAIARARVIISEAFTRKWETQTNLDLMDKAPSSTLLSVIEAYRMVSDIAPRSMKNNILSMLSIFRRVDGVEPRPASIGLDRLTKALAMRYQDLTVEKYCAEASKDEPDQREAKERAYRSSKSALNQARSLFSRRPENDLVERYASMGLVMPENIAEFTKCRLRGRAGKSDYNVPPDSVIARAFVEIHKQAEQCLDIYFAFWLAVGAGLRRKEIQNARWEHMVDKDGAVWIDGGVGKDGKRIEVRMQSKAANALAPYRKPEGWIIYGRSRVAKRLSGWMRAMGWKTEKTVHELRAYVGSKIYMKDPRAAMRFLRHKGLDTTEIFYARYAHGAQAMDVI